MSNEKGKKTPKQKIEELKTEFEKIKIEGRQAGAEQMKQIQNKMDELEKMQQELEEKYDRVENFGELAVEELSKAFFSSAEAFSGSLKKLREEAK